MEGTRNKPRCRPGLWPPIDVRRPSKEVGNRAGAADAAIVLVRCVKVLLNERGHSGVG